MGMKSCTALVLFGLFATLLPAQQMVADINPGSGSSFPKQLFQVGTRAFFRAWTPSYGDELWVTDGTRLGTRMVIDLSPGVGNSSIGFLADLNGTLLFTAGHPLFGYELWRSDGTKKGTFVVKDIYDGPLSSWIVDGRVVDGVYYFDAMDPVSGKELWRTDGTLAGTWRLSDCWPGPYHGLAWFRNGRNICALNGKILFSGADPSSGRELWISDGTKQGAALLMDTDPGPRYGNPWYLTPVGDYVFFLAYNGLWRTDGTQAGTIHLSSVRGQNLTAVGSLLYFSGDDGIHGSEPWVSDGTVKGTRMLSDLTPGAASSLPNTFVGLEDVAYFAACSHSKGFEIWKSDGSTLGTTRVQSIGQGSGTRSGIFAADAGSRFVLTVDDGVHGSEPWVSDGTLKGTRMIKDTKPGAAGAAPYMFVTAGAYVYYVADDGKHGWELWATKLSDIGGAGLTSFGRGCAGYQSEVPEMEPMGLPQLGSKDFGFAIDKVFPWGQVDLNFHLQRQDVIIDGCPFYVPSPFVVVRRAAQVGQMKVVLPIPNDPALAGMELFVQGVVMDLYGSVHGVAATTKGWELVIGR